MRHSPPSLTTLLLAIGIALAITGAGARTVIAQHRLLANEGGKLCLFGADGKLQWDMKIQGAPHDLHILPSGNILTHQRSELIEIDQESKKIVWSFDAKKLCKAQRVEVHSLQPIGENGSADKIMVAVSGEGKIFEIDRAGKVHHSVELIRDNPHPHRDTRLARRLSNGNYLVCQEGDGAVREYDRGGQLVWEFRVPLFGKQPKGGHGPEAFGNAVFSAVRLDDGNTLIGTGNGHSVLEVTHEKEIVWKLKQSDLPGITLAWVTTLEVHPNGEIVIGNCHAGKGQPQLIKLSADKKVVWKFEDFRHLGNSVSNSVILDAEPGVLR